jgi:hypothetical protein
MLGLTLAACGSGGGPVRTIAVINDAAATTYWNPSVLSAFVERSNAQLTQDVGPHWGLHVRVQLGGSADATLTFEPGTSSNGVAWHDDDNGPEAFVYVGDPTISGPKGGGTLQALLDAEHEIVEMAEDPGADGKEIVDPVACLTYNQSEPVKALECGENGEGLDRCVPDFTFPSYFDPQGKPPFDWMGVVKAPGVSPCR